MKFMTKYYQGGSEFGTHVYANDINQAIDLCRIRGIGETIEGLADIETKEVPIVFVDQVHEACFLGFVCLKANLITAEEILGDKGIIHAFFHASQNNLLLTQEHLSKIEYLRRLTPGYEPV